MNILLAVVGLIGAVGMTITVGSRSKLPDRVPWRGEFAGVSAALWMVAMLGFFSQASGWVRLVLGGIITWWAASVYSGQLDGLVSGAYARREVSEVSAEEARS